MPTLVGALAGSFASSKIGVIVASVRRNVGRAYLGGDFMDKKLSENFKKSY